MSADEREEGKLPGAFEAPDCEQLNELLPAFRFRELIACGGMGAVYRARQVSLGRDVAIKVLPPEISAAGSVFVESFKTEARTMASLSHPNLVGIHDFGEVSGMLYLVMEYIDGNALYRSIRGQKVKAVQAVEIVEEVARGLGEAHERGLLHRDIKPANILLNQKRKPVLGDFGLVVRSDAVGSGLNMGTPGYTAPEVVSDFEAASTASDVYGLGMILHEMLSGVMPTGEQAPDLSLVPELNGLRGLVGRLVSSDPSQRPVDGEALAEELASWLEGAQRMKGLVLSPAVPVARPTQPTMRSRGRGRKKGLVLSPAAPVARPTQPTVRSRGRKKGLVLSPAATGARPTQPTVRSTGRESAPLKPVGAGRPVSKLWWGLGLGALVVALLALVGIAMVQREEEPGQEQVEQPSKLEEGVITTADLVGTEAPAEPEWVVADERYYRALGLRKLSEGGLRYQTAATFVERDSAMEQSARNNLPRAPSSSMAKVIASTTPSPTAVPVPETEAEPNLDFGSGDDFGQGWGKVGKGGGFGNIPATMRKRCSPQDRMQRLKENGGTEECETAVVKALDWLQTTQAGDGSWGGGYKVAYTGLALLAYLGHCETPLSPEYGATVTNAITYLVNKSAGNKGRLGSDLQSNQWVYEHAIATYAIAEAYTFCSQLGLNLPGLREAVQLGGQTIIDGQNAAGGWTYRFSPERRNDSSVMGWCLQALKACRHTGIEFRNMERCVLDGLNAFTRNQHASGAIGYTGPSVRGDGTTLSAAGALCFQLWGQRNHPVPRKACTVINRNIKFNWKGKDTDLYGHYYASQAMINYGGKFWKEYNELFRDGTLAAQNKDGSWPLPANTGHGLGNVHYVTCLATLMLEVYYRFVP